VKKVVFCVYGAVKRVFLVDRDREVVLIYSKPYRVFVERLVPFYEGQGFYLVFAHKQERNSMIDPEN